MNTKRFGEYAVSLCATYFLAQGYQVLMPFGDSGHYDLAIEKDGIFQRIQCKRSTSVKKPQGYPRLSLQVSGTLKNENGGVSRYTVHRYTKDDFDLLWVVTLHTCYLIPLSDILHERETKSDLKLYPKWDKYRVSIPIPYPSGDENGTKRASPRLTDDDKATIKRLRKEGRKEEDIADILGVTKGCILMYLNREHKS